MKKKNVYHNDTSLYFDVIHTTIYVLRLNFNNSLFFKISLYKSYSYLLMSNLIHTTRDTFKFVLVRKLQSFDISYGCFLASLVQ